MKYKIGTACMVAGVLLVLAALGLFLWNQQEAKQAEQFVVGTLPKLMKEIETPPEYPDSCDTEYPNPYDTEMTVKEIDGYGYIGYLSIPSLDLELPVMAEWDYDRLKLAPCRYTGSTKTDDLVICAHNYARHFGPVRNLTPGDTVYFTDMDGMSLEYEVEMVDTLAPVDIEDMTAGDYDLTLFTCTYGGKSRVAVRLNAK